jgi:4-amino-4-deoxychorismate lyase
MFNLKDHALHSRSRPLNRHHQNQMTKNSISTFNDIINPPKKNPHHTTTFPKSIQQAPKRHLSKETIESCNTVPTNQSIMVKFFSQTDSYNYPFPIVSLAYFLRYPNPYSRHVLSTDVLDRHYDPITQRLYTTRLHLKRSRLPRAVMKLLPRSILGATGTGDSQTYILERSVVDVKEGWMKTESRNLEFTAVLDVIERQTFVRRPLLQSPGAPPQEENITDVHTVVTLVSRFGQRFKRQQREASSQSSQSSAQSGRSEGEEPASNLGFLARWSQSGLQRSIESIGLNRTSKSQPNAKEGMKIVLERLRTGGVVAVLEGMRRDREGSSLKLGGGSGSQTS